jgi:hypothetical protein
LPGAVIPFHANCRETSLFVIVIIPFIFIQRKFRLVRDNSQFNWRVRLITSELNLGTIGKIDPERT